MGLKVREAPGSGSDSDHHQTFAELATRLAELAGKEGLNIVPYKDPALIHLKQADFAQREHAFKMLSLMIQLFEQMHQSGHKISDTTAVLWAFCRAWKYMPAGDFQDKIQEHDMLDIYNEHGQLIFANLRFFAITSYSLEELYFRPWHKLFLHVPTTIQDDLKKVCGEILAGPTKVYDVRYLGEHTVIEAEGIYQGIFLPTFFSPLTHGGKTVGFACINRIVKVIGQ